MIPNGLDLGEFSPLPPRDQFRTRAKLDKRPIIAYLGRLSQEKESYLIEACAPMKDIQLIIAGNDMGVGKETQNAAQPYDHIHCVGLLQGRERLELLRDAHILVPFSMKFSVYLHLRVFCVEHLQSSVMTVGADNWSTKHKRDSWNVMEIVKTYEKKCNNFFTIRHFEPTWYKEEDVIYRLTSHSQKSHNNILNCTKVIQPQWTSSKRTYISFLAWAMRSHCPFILVFSGKPFIYDDKLRSPETEPLRHKLEAIGV